MVNNVSSQLLAAKEILEKIGLLPGQTLADLGCGAVGHFIFTASDLVGREGKIYAVDIRQLVLTGIKNRARLEGRENIVPIRANLEILKSTGIPDNGVDVALIVNTLGQNDKRVEILREATRLVKPGGRLAVLDWRPGAGGFGLATERRVNPEGVKRFAAGAGLTLQAEWPAGPYHFGLLFIKQ